MRRLSGIFLLTLTMMSVSFAQSKKIDSLKNLLNQSSLPDTSLVSLNCVLAQNFIPIDVDSAEKYLKRAQIISLKKANDRYESMK